MSDDGWSYWRWHTYPWQNNIESKADQLARVCDRLAVEIREHNPVLHVSTAEALRWVDTVSNEMSAELRAANAQTYAQRWLYKKLIEEGRCP